MELNRMARCLTYNKNRHCNQATPGTRQGVGRWIRNEATGKSAGD